METPQWMNVTSWVGSLQRGFDLGSRATSPQHRTPALTCRALFCMASCFSLLSRPGRLTTSDS